MQEAVTQQRSVRVSPASLPDNSFAAGQLVSQEAQNWGFLGRRVGLEGLGLQTEGQRSQFCIATMGSHVHL